MTKKLILSISFFFFIAAVSGQHTSVQIIDQLQSRVDALQRRIDLFDHSEDRAITLKSDELSVRATETYIGLPDKIQIGVNADASNDDLLKAKQLRKLIELLEDVNDENYLRYNAYNRVFTAICQVQQMSDVEQLLNTMSNHMEAMLKVVPFYENKPVAENFLTQAATLMPKELMQAYKEFEYQPYAQQLIEKAISNDPDYTKNYLSTFSPIYYVVKKSNDPLADAIRQIFASKGSSSKAYILAHQVAQGKLTVSEAHQITADETKSFAKLINYRTSGNCMGEASVDRELEYLALQKVRVINELHDEKDTAVRFAAAANLNVSQLYALIVYTEDEIFTSSFLGLFDRLMHAQGEESTYELLFNNDFLRFRRFLKMCAGYGVLPDFLSKMSDFERKVLLQKLTGTLLTDKDLVRQCAAVADVYSSINNKALKKAVLDGVQQMLPLVKRNQQAILLLYQILQSDYDSTAIDWFDAMKVMKNHSVYKDGSIVEQHFFYNDDDGKASFTSFLASYRNENWKITDKKLFVVIETVKGRKIKMYANKPESEYDGQDAIDSVFARSGQWPDIVVHRGHSFYVETTMQAVTPATRLIILGSCGGYRNIFDALVIAPEADIISTKQVGTLLVNDILIYTLNEQLRNGKDIRWRDLWNLLDKKFKSTATAGKFDEYIAPDANYGAIFLRRYNTLF